MLNEFEKLQCLKVLCMYVDKWMYGRYNAKFVLLLLLLLLFSLLFSLLFELL